MKRSIISFLEHNAALFVFAIASIAFAGSLIAEWSGVIPCELCWFQRICLYPLIPITLVGMIRHDRNLPWYVIPLSIIGSIVALYQYLLYTGIIDESLAPCSIGVSCTQELPTYLGFFNLINLSFLAFVTITVLMIISARGAAKEQQ